MLVEFCTLTDDILLSGWVVKLPTFVPTRISNKQAFFHMWLKGMSLVLLNKDIGKASPNSEMRDIGFALEPRLMWTHAFERRRRKAVPNVDLSGKRFPPK